MANNFDNYLDALNAANAAGATKGTLDYFDEENRKGVDKLTKAPRTDSALMNAFLRGAEAQAEMQARQELPTSVWDDITAGVSSAVDNTAQTAHGLASLSQVALSEPARDHYIREVINSEAYKNASPEMQQVMLHQAEADMERSRANMYRGIADRSEAISDFAGGLMTAPARREMDAAQARSANIQNVLEKTDAPLGDQIGLGIRSMFQNPTQAAHTVTGVASDFVAGGAVNKAADLAIDATKAAARRGLGYLGRENTERLAADVARNRTNDVITAKADDAAIADAYKGLRDQYAARRLDYFPNTPDKAYEYADLPMKQYFEADYLAARKATKELEEAARAESIEQSNSNVKDFLKKLGGVSFIDKLNNKHILDAASAFTNNAAVRWAGRRLREGAGLGVVEGLQTASEGFGQVQQELDRISDHDFLDSQVGNQLYRDEYAKLIPLVENGSIGQIPAINLAMENARARAASEAHTNYMMTAPVMNAGIQTVMGATVPSMGRALTPLFRGSGAGANLAQAASEVVQEGLSGYGSNELMRRFINPYGGQVSSASGFAAGQEAAGGLVGAAPHAARGSLQAATNLAASAGRGMVKGYRAVRPQKPAAEPQAPIQAQDIPSAPTPEATQRIVDEVVTAAPQDKQTQAQVNSYLQKEMEEATVDFIPSETDNTVVRSQVSTADLDDYEPTSPREAEIKDELSRRLNEYNQEPTTERASNVQKYLDEVGPELSDDFIDITLKPRTKTTQIASACCVLWLLLTLNAQRRRQS